MAVNWRIGEKMGKMVTICTDKPISDTASKAYVPFEGRRSETEASSSGLCFVSVMKGFVHLGR
jgi:hypothetical protein